LDAGTQDLKGVKHVMQDSLRLFKAGIFQAMANPTRIAIVELLRDLGEVPVTSLSERLELEQANVSQHLAVLRAKQIVVSRKEGNQVFYSLRNRAVGKVLDLMSQFFHSHLEESLALLEEMRTNSPKMTRSSTEGRKR
jgi:DNA-binding transcriptional ArsR family regulator